MTNFQKKELARLVLKGVSIYTLLALGFNGATSRRYYRALNTSKLQATS